MPQGLRVRVSSCPPKKMKVTTENKTGLKKILKVFIDKKTMNDHMIEKYDEIKKTVVLKGFRPGKVPAEILKKQFGKAIFAEVLDKVLKDTSSKAIADSKIKIASQPKLDLKVYGEDKDLEYTMEIEELPKVNIDKINDIKINEYEIKVSEKDINTKIEEIAKNQNNFKDKDKNEVSKNEDLVIFDYSATIDGEKFEGGEGKNTQIILGKDLFIKGFDKQLTGIKVNEEVKVDTILPESYPNKKYANKKANFLCKILNVKKPIDTIINEEFAKNLGAKDLNDLKVLVSKQITDQYKQTLDIITKNEILDQLNKSEDIQIPETLISQEVDLLSQGMNEEDKKKHKFDHEKSAKKRIKTGLLLNEFGEINKINVEEDEIKKEIQKQISTMPGQEKMVIDYYQKNPSAAASLRGGILEEKIISLIKEKAKSKKNTITIQEAEKLIINQNKHTHNHNHDHHSKNVVKEKTSKVKKKPSDKKKIVSKSKKKSSKK